MNLTDEERELLTIKRDLEKARAEHQQAIAERHSANQRALIAEQQIRLLQERQQRCLGLQPWQVSGAPPAPPPPADGEAS